MKSALASRGERCISTLAIQLCAYVCVALGMVAAASAAPLPWEMWKNLRNIAVLDTEQGSYLASSYCLDGCRYDRSSIDPGQGSQRFIRIERTSAGQQAVIFEQAGAGAVTRIWMTTGDGRSKPLPTTVRIRIYFDGDSEPRIDMPLDQFFLPHADAAPFSPSLSADKYLASGGNVTYLPFPYRNGIRIALLNGMDTRLWYQINYQQVADANRVASYEPDSYPDDLANFLGQAWRTDWLRAHHRPSARIGIGERAAPALGQTHQLTMEAPVTLFNQAGPGWLLASRIHVPRERWDEVQIRFAFDGETTVDLPLLEFFTASRIDQARPQGVFAGVDADGAFRSSMPMPFRESAQVSLQFRDGVTAAPLLVHSSFAADDHVPASNAAVFRTQTHTACPSTAGRDAILLQHQGAGRMIGLALWMGTVGLADGGYYLEGDERLYIDGSLQPLWYGTGVEDMFNGGFYFDEGAYSAALAGAPYRYEAGRNDRASMYRWFLGDAPSWRSSMVFKMESGPWGREPLCLRSVAYYYGQDQASQDVLAVLDVGDPESAGAAGYVPGPETLCWIQTGQFGDEPPTSRTATVCAGRDSSRFAFALPEAGQYFRLRRTYDAGLAGQAAELWVNGERVGGWADVQANPYRRWSQLDIDFRLTEPTANLAIEVRPLPGRALSVQSWQLWGNPRSAGIGD
ncbi:MAG: DUF2961 domain-containing protein [Dokdonella sp.]